jgi:hypothetical protein
VALAAANFGIKPGAVSFIAVGFYLHLLFGKGKRPPQGR